MKRIFYYSGYRLTIFHFDNEECVAMFAFNPGDEGLEKFNTYLMATTNTPVRLLVDLIEEDFKKDTIPHVGASDRKSIVSRLVNRQYRQSKDYVHYKVIDRETTGRKDDVLLYSVLSNPDILQSWLKPMQDAGISISGIWSLPLLTESLYKHIERKSKNILLVSQQVPSNLRQTFLKNGKFESSRSAVVNLDDASIGEYISTEVEQTLRFLSNQRHIGFDEKIQIHVICRKLDLENIQSECIDSSLRTFHYHDLAAIQSTFGCSTQSLDYSNSIYSYICSLQKIPIGHYGHKSLFSKYYEQITSKALYIASATLLILATITSFSFISDSILLDEESITLNAQTVGINSDYEKQLAKLEPRLKKTQIMKSSVLLHRKIIREKLISPQKFMLDASRILSRTGMHDTELTQVFWQQTQISELSNKQNNKLATKIDYGNSAVINHLVTLSGFIRLSKSSIKQSVYKTNSLAEAFKNNKLVRNVNITRMPIDIRSKASIQYEASSDKNTNIKTDRQKGKFEIDILMQGHDS